MKAHSNPHPSHWFTEQLNSHFPSLSTPSLCHALSPFSSRSVTGAGGGCKLVLSATRSTGLPVGLQNQGSLFLALSSCLLFEGLSGKESACDAGEETWV